MPHHDALRRHAARRTRARRLLPAAVAAVLLALPCAAHPVSLSHLLRLPLEELLRLEIAMHDAQPRAGTPAARPLRGEGRQP